MQASDYAAVLAVWMLAIATPGPDVVLILRESVRNGRAGAVSAALGIVGGVVVWLVLAMTGAHLLLEADDRLLGGLQLVGGLYLLHLGIGALRAGWSARPSGGPARVDHAAVLGAGPAPEPATDVPPSPRSASFRRGLLTNLSNPKALVFFGTVFSVLVPASTTTAERIVLSVVLSAVAATWFCGLARVSSSRRVADVLTRHGAVFDGVAGVAFVVLAGLAIATGVSTLAG